MDSIGTSYVQYKCTQCVHQQKRLRVFRPLATGKPRGGVGPPRRPAATHTRLLTEFERSVTDFLQKKETKEAAAAAIRRPAFQTTTASRRQERFTAAAAAVADEEEEEAAAVSREIDGEATSIIDVSTLKRKKVFFGVWLATEDFSPIYENSAKFCALCNASCVCVLR